MTTTPSRSSCANKAKTPSSKKTTQTGRLGLLLSFLLGCAISSMLILNAKILSIESSSTLSQQHPGLQTNRVGRIPSSDSASTARVALQKAQEQGKESRSVLDGVRILVAIAAYDFSQLPHLEEVLDGYFDLCFAGAYVKVVIHTTVPFSVPLIDLLNSRLTCTNPSQPKSGFDLQIVLKSPSVRLHLVDFHRTLFYSELQHYDLFIYTEDDIRVTPTTVASYLIETRRIQEMLGGDLERSANYNVGIVRYEYNFPPDIIINDKTRHATQNVTRVYWEHSWKPPIPKSIDGVAPLTPALGPTHATMTNHHQGMFLATRFLLEQWKKREGCQFDVIRDRPGLKNKPSQPSEGTQRVWMSSNMLYGKRHCNVQQVLPLDKFGSLTVLHLPNKNYRRLGKKGRLGGADKKNDPSDNATGAAVEFDLPSPQLLTAMELHIAMRKQWPMKPQVPYRGIDMVDQIGGRASPFVERRLADFKAYAQRGGVMSDHDFTQTQLVE